MYCGMLLVTRVHGIVLQVDSNDKLYGQNKKYLAQVDELLNTVLVKIISYIDAIG